MRPPEYTSPEEPVDHAGSAVPEPELPIAARNSLFLRIEGAGAKIDARGGLCVRARPARP